jgi:hypothetical protein
MPAGFCEMKESRCNRECSRALRTLGRRRYRERSLFERVPRAASATTNTPSPLPAVCFGSLIRRASSTRFIINRHLGCFSLPVLMPRNRSESRAGSPDCERFTKIWLRCKSQAIARRGNLTVRQRFGTARLSLLAKLGCAAFAAVPARSG